MNSQVGQTTQSVLVQQQIAGRVAADYARSQLRLEENAMSAISGADRGRQPVPAQRLMKQLGTMLADQAHMRSSEPLERPKREPSSTKSAKARKSISARSPL